MTRQRSQEELEFLQKYDPGDFERPSVAVDVVILTLDQGTLKVFLVQRTQYPDKEQWSLPGGFVGMEESLDDAARRLLDSKGGISGVFLEQLYTFGEPSRDPRMRIITVSYYALVPIHRMNVLGEHAILAEVNVPWEGEEGGAVEAYHGKTGPLPFAFDHNDILSMTILRIRGKLSYTPIGFELLPEKFTLRELRDVHEAILGHPLNKDSFRRKVLASGLVKPTGEKQSEVGHRPAELYVYQPAS